MDLFAIDDLHVGFADNRRALQNVRARRDAALILAGDIGETTDHLADTLDTLLPASNAWFGVQAITNSGASMRAASAVKPSMKSWSPSAKAAACSLRKMTIRSGRSQQNAV